ncbi:telomere regulation protein Stn1-domain-containing protein [Tirmania nivea]|nr:telomere regulation protein Stn1-domain-containing protein [Tirmania nivea]
MRIRAPHVAVHSPRPQLAAGALARRAFLWHAFVCGTSSRPRTLAPRAAERPRIRATRPPHSPCKRKTAAQLGWRVPWPGKHTLYEPPYTYIPAIDSVQHAIYLCLRSADTNAWCRRWPHPGRPSPFACGLGASPPQTIASPKQSPKHAPSRTTASARNWAETEHATAISMADNPPSPSRKRRRLSPPSQPLTFYAGSLFHLSPVFATWAKLTAQDVYSLQTRAGFGGQKIYFYLNHPVRWVRLMGVVVSFEEFEEQGRVLIHLDDGSGKTIQLVYFKQGPSRPSGAQNIDFRGISLHSVVKAKGEISEFRNSRQITLCKIELVKDTNAEAEAWRAATAFKRDILLKPWVISDEQIEKEKKRRRHEQRVAERAALAAEKERLERIAENAAANGRVHRDSSAETILIEQKPKAFIGRRREKKPEDQENQLANVKRAREPTAEPVSPSYKRVKKEPAVDTVSDRRRIQEILAQRENLEIAAVKAGRKAVYTTEARHKVRIKEEERDEEERDEEERDEKERDEKERDESKPPRAGGEMKARVRSTRGHDRTRRASSAAIATRRSSRIPSQHKDRPRIKSESVAAPPPPAPPDPEIYTHRSLKLVILSHIQNTPLPNFTVSNLRLIPEIEEYTAKVAAAQNAPPQPSSSTNPPAATTTSAQIFKAYCDVLQTLVHDGNIMRVPPPSAHAYVAVGKWNLNDLIQEAMASAKGLARQKHERAEKERIDAENEEVETWRRPAYGAAARPTGRVTVRSIWMKARARGGGWQGVTKGVVAEVVNEVLEGEGGWSDVGRGIWEWEVQGGWEPAV